MCWVQLLTSAVQFLCISIPLNLLQVILKRRAEISADILFVFFSISALLQEFDNKMCYSDLQHEDTCVNKK